MLRYSERLAGRWVHAMDRNGSLQEKLEKEWGKDNSLEVRLEELRKHLTDTDKELDPILRILADPPNLS